MKKILQSKRFFAVFYSFLTLYLGFFPLISCRAPDSDGQIKGIISAEESAPPPAEPELSFAELSAFFEGGRDLILDSYRDPELKEKVLVFFGDLTGSYKIAEAVLTNSAVYKIAPALAFSLCAEESGYNPQALNRNRNDTIDRGLFQLNSASFPKLSVVDFYNIDINARYGLSHLRWCLDSAGTEVAALAMYNAGSTRVNSHGTPKHTLDYVSRILGRQRKIERLFLTEYPGMIVTETSEAPKKTAFRLSLLTPLGGR